MSVSEKERMTEKSEDQVVYVCPDCHFTTQNNKEICERYGKDHEIVAVPFIPHSKYLAIKSDLALAVEALQNIHIHRGGILDEELFLKTEQFSRIAQEALGKIGEKKSE